MPDALTPTKTTINFASLPPLIREWLASNRLTYAIMAINRRLGLANERQSILPGIIYDLVIMEIRPRDFAQELSAQLDISFSSAKIIAREIEEKILSPVEATLKNELGIDAKLIYLGEEREIRRPTTSEGDYVGRRPAKTIGGDFGQRPIAAATKEMPTFELKSAAPEGGEPRPDKSGRETAAPAPETPPAVSRVEPFILHEEPTTAKLTEEKQTSRPSFVFRTPAAVKPPSEKPVEVKLETAKQNQDKGRVVHYSNFRTKL